MEYKLPLGTFILGVVLGYLLLPTNTEHGKAGLEYPVPVVDTEMAKVVTEPMPSKVEQLQSNTTIVLNDLTLDDLPQDIKAQVEELAETAADLETQNELLKQHNEQAMNNYLQEKQKRLALERELGALQDSDISDEQMRALLDAPYDTFMSAFRGETRDRVYDFFKQPEDLDDGFRLQTQIADFIQSHALSSGVQLDGITCKQTTCELRVFEKDPANNNWHIIWNEMVIQPFWQFNSTHSSSKGMGNENPGVWLFIFTERLGA